MVSLTRRVSVGVVAALGTFALSGCQMVEGLLNPDRSEEIRALHFSVTAPRDAWLMDDYDNGAEEKLWKVPVDDGLQASLCAVQDDIAVVGFNVGAATDGGEVRLIDIRSNKEVRSFKGMSCTANSGIVDGKAFVFSYQSQEAEFATLDVKSGELVSYKIPGKPELSAVTGVGIKRGSVIVVANLEFAASTFVVSMRDNNVQWEDKLVTTTPNCLLVKKYVGCTTESEGVAFDVETGRKVVEAKVRTSSRDHVWASDGYYSYPDGPGERFDGKPVNIEGEATRLYYPTDREGATVPLAELDQGFNNAHSFVINREGKVVAHTHDGDWRETQTGETIDGVNSLSGPRAATGSGKTFVLQGTGEENSFFWSVGKGRIFEMPGVTDSEINQLDGYLVIGDYMENSTQIVLPKGK